MIGTPLPVGVRGRSPRSVWRATAIGLAVLAVGLTGCASGGGGSLQADFASYGAPTPEAAVRGFLQALRSRDYPAMARYFGTESGPAEEKWGVEEVEQRMLVLAGVLDHEESNLQPSRRSVPNENKRRFILSLTGTRYGSVSLPVVTARWREGRWFVERIDTSSLSP